VNVLGRPVIAVLILLLIGVAQSRAEQLPIRTYTTADGLARDGVYKIVTDPRGFLWFCTYDSLSRFDGYEFVNYGVAQGLPHRSIHDLLITRNGDYWVATSAGVAHFNAFASTSDPNFKAYLPGQRPGSEIITDLYESGGAMKITRRGFISYSEADGLEHERIAAIGEDRNGELYVVTGSIRVPSFHIHRFNGRKFQNTRVNLPPDVVPTWGWNQLFVHDRMQQWWVPTANGLFQFPVLRSFADLAKARPDALWFGTLQGLSKLVPTIDDGPPQPPPILIQHVRVAGDDLPISELGITQMGDLEFQASKNQFEIKFVSLGFRTGDVLRYQFMLEGADKDWGAPINQRVVNYANLRTGSYRFLVRQ
jgi:ligand-binding sensor domain-containing protein